MPLVGRVPSVVEQWLWDYNEEHGFEHRYSSDGGVVSAELGVFVRVQRAGDILLTRPVFLAKEWTGACGTACIRVNGGTASTGPDLLPAGPAKRAQGLESKPEGR